MSDRKLLVDLHGQVVGTTFSTSVDSLVRATHPTTGDDWGLMAVRPLNWPRRRPHIKDLETFKVNPA